MRSAKPRHDHPPANSADARNGESVAAFPAGQAEWRVKGCGEVLGGEHAGVGPGGEEASGAEEEGVGEKRDDFLDVMRDEDERGRVSLRAEALEEGEEVFAG